MAKLIAFLIAGAYLVALSFGIVAMEALVFMVSWGLFMHSVFGLPLLAFTQAIGAMLILNIVTFPVITSINGVGNAVKAYSHHRIIMDTFYAIKAGSKTGVMNDRSDTANQVQE